MCERTFDPTPWIAVLISAVALFVGYYTLRLQVISTIEEKLTDKAKECNNHIVAVIQSFPVETSILYASHILDLQYKTYKVFLLARKQQAFKDIFYLKLHTSISEYVHRNQLKLVPDNLSLGPIIKRQLQDAHNFLEESDLKFRFK